MRLAGSGENVFLVTIMKNVSKDTHCRRQQSAGLESRTPASARETSSTHMPEFIRLPKPGERCSWTGLSRGSLNDLILGEDAPVRSAVIRQPGASKGIRILHLDSLLSHLHQLMEEQESQGGAL